MAGKSGEVSSERNIQALILMALSEAGCLVWRQDTGAYKAPDGRLIRYGLCPGSADVIGVAKDGRFLAVEVKAANGRVSPAQVQFLDAVRRAGGRAGVARSVDDALSIALCDT